MSVILNFKRWRSLNESLEEQEIANLKVLDTIQQLADSGPNMATRNTKATSPESLKTSLDGENMIPTKSIEFNAAKDPDTRAGNVGIKAKFFVDNGVLKATVWKGGVLTLSGEVKIKNPGGANWKQISQIGTDVCPYLIGENGAQTEYAGYQSPIAAGVLDILEEKVRLVKVAAARNKPGFNENDIQANNLVAYAVPRGKSNVKWSNDSVELISFVETKKAAIEAAKNKP